MARDAQGRRHHGRRHPEQAKIAEDAGAVAVMRSERVPAILRGQVALLACLTWIFIIGRHLLNTSIPSWQRLASVTLLKHCVLSLGVDYIDESEVLTSHYGPPHRQVELHCSSVRGDQLGEALRRINEGAAMIRS